MYEIHETRCLGNYCPFTEFCDHYNIQEPDSIRFCMQFAGQDRVEDVYYQCLRGE